MKICHTCQQAKELTEFHKDRTAKDGLASSCKICRNAAKRNTTKFTSVKLKEPYEEKTFTISIDPYFAFAELIKKHHSFINLTINNSGKARLQIFSTPAISYKSDSLESLLFLVYNSECL